MVLPHAPAVRPVHGPPAGPAGEWSARPARARSAERRAPPIVARPSAPARFVALARVLRAESAVPVRRLAAAAPPAFLGRFRSPARLAHAAPAPARLPAVSRKSAMALRERLALSCRNAG